MKFSTTNICIVILTLGCFSLSCIQRDIRRATSFAELRTFDSLHPEYETSFEYFYSKVDSQKIFEPLYQAKVGSIVKIEDSIFKILEIRTDAYCKVKYIYLNGTILTLRQVDSLQAEIISRYRNGIDINTLCTHYSMDGASRIGCDLGWIRKGGGIIDEFADTSLLYNKGDIFEINIARNKWYYVVLKTEENTEMKFVRAYKFYRKP